MGRWLVVTIAVTAALGHPGLVQGQSTQWLVKGGVHSTTIDWSPSRLGTGLENVERRTGLTAGLALSFSARERIRFHLEGLYSEKGFTERPSPDQSTSLEVAYIEIPALVGWTLTPPETRWRPQFYAGPWVALEVQCTAIARAGTVGASFDCDDVPDDPVLRETWDWGASVGGLVEGSTFGSWIARLDIRYSRGLRNVDAAPEIDNVGAHHRGFAVTIGLGRGL